MPRFAPFPGLRYNVSRVDLSATIAPPYDVITPGERAGLVGRHSANAVRVELPEPDHRAGLDRYQSAAAAFERWRSEGILLRDGTPSYYVHRMTTPHGVATTGVIGALDVDGDLLPHEETLPRARSDRYDLLAATRVNTSPVWGLSLTAGLGAVVSPTGEADERAVDDQGTVHEVWVVDDPDWVEAIRQAVADSPVVVADGHHRLETARAFADADGGPGTGQVMALVVELADGELEVGPIHRGLAGLPADIDLAEAFSTWFDVTRAGDFDDRTVGALGESHSLALVTAAGAWMLSPKDGTAEAAGARLDAATAGLVIAGLPAHDLTYVNSWQEAARAVARHELQAAVLLRPLPVDVIAEWARAGRRMPAKSTYFHPKPRTGMVFRTLDDGT